MAVIEQAPYLDLGEGPVPPDAVSELVRNLRNNQRILHTLFTGHQTLVLDATKGAAAAQALAQRAQETAAHALAASNTLEQDLYGNPRHPDDRGALGQLSLKIERLPGELLEVLDARRSRQVTRAGWLIFGAIVAALALVAVSLIFHQPR